MPHAQETRQRASQLGDELLQGWIVRIFGNVKDGLHFFPVYEGYNVAKNKTQFFT
jgi:hypothetical protein